MSIQRQSKNGYVVISYLGSTDGDRRWFYLFNPTGLVMDEAGGNWKALQLMFGDDAIGRAVSCEFHYKQSVLRKSCKLPDGESKGTFEKLAYSLLEAKTVIVFEKRGADMNRFIKEREEQKCLKTWVEWWDARKSHIFRALKEQCILLP